MKFGFDGNAIVRQIPVHEKMEVCRHGVKRSDKIWLGPSWGTQKTLILCTPASGSALPLQAHGVWVKADMELPSPRW